ncbi:hypothetical protein LOD99_4572 [Oopsacas minuta]|uniref:Uncharacterized protein n=1 Tax=Oopsacas minuta TaxID=111878 RepID=A0AAV7JTA9_9METZ|nr:hypothetical protein LOD99_4572 [Oopsacas minuta]
MGAAGEHVIWEVQGELYILVYCSFLFIACLIAFITGSSLVFNTQVTIYNSFLIICSILQFTFYLFAYIPFLYYYEMYSLARGGWLVQNLWIAMGWTGYDYILLHKQLYYDIILCVYVHLPLLILLIKKIRNRGKGQYFLQAILGTSHLRGHLIGCLVGLHLKGWKKFFFTLLPRLPLMLIDFCYILGSYYYFTHGVEEEIAELNDDHDDISTDIGVAVREKQD